ncbi:hypothetical protein KJ937_04625 [Patescibacteria group bacterium]|nr:hypothetical protein [Patescibacteria group bacterium]MBU2509601.1 hypothetical protein [Patescibacteria group bacterium]
MNFKPPVEIARAGEKGLKFRRMFKRGGTPVGIMRARDLKNRRTLSPSTIMRMVSFFSRHAVDKKGKDYGNEKRPSNGYIAWLLWGGDPGFKWALKIKREIKLADRQSKSKSK